MKRKITLFTLALAVIFITNSCAPSTPASRIAQNPIIFKSLSSNDKQLAQKGQIKRGMHKDGVLIAWGKPRRMITGSRNGKSYEKWIYTRLSPIYVNNFQPYATFGYHRFGHHRFGHHRFGHHRFGHHRFGCHHNRFGYNRGFGIGYGPDIHYIQRTAATVEFDQKSKVTDWTARR